MTYSIFPIGVYFPSVGEILQAIIILFTTIDFYVDIFESLKRVLVGFSLACIMGIALGLSLGYEKRLRDIKVFIEILRPIPPIAWIPIAIILFGLGDVSAYFIVFMGSFFPIFTNTYFGASSIPTIYENVAASFEIGKISYFRNILFKYSLPYIFTGLKIGIGMAWMSVIAAELIGAQSGLGYFIQLNRLLLQSDKVIVGMISIGAIGYVLHLTIELVERKVISWR